MLQTVEFLKKTQLEVPMHTSVQYTLTKEIVCRQFLRRVRYTFFFLSKYICVYKNNADPHCSHNPNKDFVLLFFF